MNSQIHSAIISSFEDLLNPVAWRDLRDALKHAEADLKETEVTENNLTLGKSSLTI